MPRLPAQPNMTRVPSGDTAAYSSSPSYPPPGTMQTPNPMVHASGGWLQNPPMPYQVPQGPLGPQYSQPNGLYNGVYPNTLNNHTGPGPALQSNGAHGNALVTDNANIVTRARDIDPALAPQRIEGQTATDLSSQPVTLQPNNTSAQPATTVVTPVEEHVAVETGKKRKRPRKGQGGGEGEMVGGLEHETLKAGARSSCRLVTPFTHIYHIVTEGVNYDLDRDARLRGQSPLGPGSRPTQEELKEIKKTSTRRQVEGWFIMCDEIAGFREAMKSKAKQVADFKKICDTINWWVGSTRCNDTGKLKKDCLGYINVDLKPIWPPLTGASLLDKSKCGWSHHQLGVLLMPVEYEPTEANLKNLLAGDPMMPVTHKMMPRFLYPDGYVWNPSCPMVDLFKGHFLIYCLQHMLLSPSSVVGDETQQHRRNGIRKGNNSELLGITWITPRLVAYACVQARHCLNQQTEWHPVDGAFHAEKFFWSIVTILEDEVRGKALLTEINAAVFGPRPRIHYEDSGDESDDESLAAKYLRSGNPAS